jgi:peroxiredoxin Q/BCP
MRIEPVLGIALLGLLAWAGPWAKKGEPDADHGGGLKEGSAAPDFEAPSSEGGTLRLSSLRGKIVVLYFYPKDDTAFCKKEACSFRDAFGDMQKMGAVLLGVSKDDLNSHDRFKKKYNLPFALLSDPDGKIFTAYGCWKKGSLFGRTALGVDRSTFLIDPQGIVRKIWRSVNVNGHDQEVLAAVKELASENPSGAGQEGSIPPAPQAP